VTTARSGMNGSASWVIEIAFEPRVVTWIFSSVLQGQRVHHRGQHAHSRHGLRSMPGPAATPDVAAATTTAVCSRSTTSASWRAISAVASVLMPYSASAGAEGLAGELQQHAPVLGSRRASVVGHAPPRRAYRSWSTQTLRLAAVGRLVVAALAH
jgi:hypothetical protein